MVSVETCSARALTYLDGDELTRLPSWSQCKSNGPSPPTTVQVTSALCPNATVLANEKGPTSGGAEKPSVRKAVTYASRCGYEETEYNG
ncbi:hypothetical protein HPB48_008459 [Haemaphysalis longicornis]|uniref:Uncharacterized protein n=1 Tax=Haemaphysalis longicornis TaxID=44386 RepID=A0A9J6FN89_HAELO|nr:hypothetical protein HPB48_008459 [Haemaphysalis longicornis]